MTQKTRMLVNLAAAVVVAAGLGTYAYVGVFQAEQAEEARKSADEKLVPLESAAVKKLTVQAKGETTVLEKRDGSWRIVSPVEAAADSSAVEALVSRLAEARRKSEVKASDPKPYGLDAPRITVAAEGDGAKAELALGARNGFDGTLFAKDGAGRFATVDSSLEGALGKTTLELREKRLVVVGEDQVASLQVKAGGQAFTLAKKDDGWWLDAPVEEHADDETASAMLRALQDLRATAFPATGDFGLDAPVAEVRLQRKEGAALELKIAEKEKKLYVQADGGPVAEVPTGLVEKLVRTVEELRDKRLFPGIDTEAVARVRFAGEGGDWEAEKRDGKWVLLGTKETPASGWKMQGVVSSVGHARASSFAAGSVKAGDLGLDAPKRSYTLLSADGKELARMLLGREETGFVWVQAGSRMARVDKTRIGSLYGARSELVEEAATGAGSARATAE